jgi:DNA gyrase inhibitor GyrI
MAPPTKEQSVQIVTDSHRGAGIPQEMDSPFVMKKEQSMVGVDVRIERLAPMRVASFCCFSETPEQDAWAKLSEWADSRGLLVDLDRHPIFGFNNPNPSPRGGKYGYELWIRVDSDIESDHAAEVKRFEGGLYAVTTCRLHDDPSGTMPEVWHQLWEWVEESDYDWRPTHELEKARNPGAPGDQFLLDLYLPIEE